ncbi:hypothetical protein Q765_18270 [Flavobacterium rivuli WB 3.3-2 = DSM 21788]|uniref:Lipoprotein n=1 Tax=Flavobacterium rivuli WB 3.3-2 = DSM 21788 TaxID=1121895 RepID=A0A0A2LXH2_9FLAO|nr:hypothetical protein [Flavobacterium rivuli]KGO85087.1 hypothetical protein Q765_18270 [Flavobacterium rivuli WB 3.3-2 = DSM 21788]
MKKFVNNLAVFMVIALTGLFVGCKDKAEKADSYGPNENYSNETPTNNDNAAKDSTIHETGPGSATVGDTVNRTPPANK